MLALLGSDEDTLSQVDAAVQRIEDGGYGRCEECGEAILKLRLDAVPYAADCVRCASHAQAGNSPIAFPAWRRTMKVLEGVATHSPATLQ